MRHSLRTSANSHTRVWAPLRGSPSSPSFSPALPSFHNRHSWPVELRSLGFESVCDRWPGSGCSTRFVVRTRLFTVCPRGFAGEIYHQHTGHSGRVRPARNDAVSEPPDGSRVWRFGGQSRGTHNPSLGVCACCSTAAYRPVRQCCGRSGRCVPELGLARSRFTLRRVLVSEGFYRGRSPIVNKRTRQQIPRANVHGPHRRCQRVWQLSTAAGNVNLVPPTIKAWVSRYLVAALEPPAQEFGTGRES